MSKLLIFIILFISLIGCEPREDIYTYTEVQIESPQEQMRVPAADDPHSFMESNERDISWAVPQGWREEKGSGMRMATISKDLDGRALEITLINLSGPVGGLEANLRRWLGQINITEPQAVEKLLTSVQHFDLAGGLTAAAYDFTPLTINDLDNSILAGVIKLESGNLFIKILATKADLDQVRDDFMQFVQSITIK